MKKIKTFLLTIILVLNFQSISFSKKSNCKIITTEKDYNRLGQNLNKEIKFIKSELEIINEKDFLNNLFKLYG